MEAGTGIEPVFTDLQSSTFSPENNDLGEVSYQDKSETAGEHDTHHGRPKMENPGALAGATGVDKKPGKDFTKAYSDRLARARKLRAAIAECDPVDAALILSDALERLRAGAPIPPLLNAMDEARSWAEWAPAFERKAYALVCFQSLTATEKEGFLAHVTGAQRHA